jgi:hypothetical protein
MLFSFNSEPTQKYPSATHLRKPSSEKSARCAGKNKWMEGTLKSNIGRGRQGTISVMTSLWFQHGPMLEKNIFSNLTTS